MEAVYVDKHIELVRLCKLGDRKAQYELYKHYVKAMFNVAARIVNDIAEAEDVLQEAFLDAFTRISDFRQETTFGLWLKQIVINKSINFLRKRKAELVSIETTNLADELYEEEGNEDEVELQVENVKSAIKELPDGYRVVLSLYLLEGYDHEEIAHILKISENTSRSQLMRAKRRLVESLKKSTIKE